MLKSTTIVMLKDQAIAFLKIRPEETRLVSLMAVLFLCVQAGQGIGENAAFALFLSRVDVDFLPYMYMGLGGVVFLASIAYSASLSRFQNSSVVVNLLLGSVFLFAVEWLLVVLFNSSISFPALWLTTYGMGVVFGTLLWTVAGEVCDARQAKRLFPLFTSMGILGSVLGNSLTGVIANLFGANSLIFVYAILLGGGFLVTRQIADTYFKPEPVTDVKFSLVADIRSGYDFVIGSQLFRLIAVSSILYSVLFFTVDFPFSERISNAYLNDAAGLAGFKGLFTSVVTAVTFLVSLFLANRLYARLGIVNSVLLMPVTYIIAFFAFFVSFNFWGAVSARFGQLVVLGGLMGTAWNALFNVVPPDQRGQVLAFNNGVPAQVGVVLSGVLIILSKQFLGTQDVLLLGAFVALVAVRLTMKMRSAYGDELLNALRAGRVEVFSEDEEAFSGYKDDPAALQVVLKALQDPRPDTRRLAVEMLARMGNILAAPDLIERLSDEDAGVRAAATRVLAELDMKPAFGDVILGLDDPDDDVRVETLASLPKLGVASSPELIRTLERSLKDNNSSIRARAAVVLVHFRESEHALACLVELLHDEDVHTRHVALEALGHIAGNVEGGFPFDVSLVFNALGDPSPVIRRDAIRVLSLLKDWEVGEPLLERLSDEDAAVRKAASETLKQAWPQSRTGILRVLEQMNEFALDAALDAIPMGDPDVLPPLRGYIQREVSNIRQLRVYIDSVPRKGRATGLLIDALKQRGVQSEGRLIKAVGLFGNPRALDLIRRSLNAGDASTRAAALEALETLGDKRITTEVLPILDRGGVFQAEDEQRINVTDAVGELLSNEENWLRALAAYAVPELKLYEFKNDVHALMSDPSLLVKDAARNAFARMEGTIVMKKIKNLKTLKTLSTLDRILLLRDVPMFSELSPEDLEKIADIADEQLYFNQTTLCNEGEPGNTLFIIARGKVDVVIGAGSQEKVIATRGEGEFVGEMAIFESAPRSATLKASGDVRVLIIDGDAFIAILHDRPDVAISVLKHMSMRVRELNEKIGMTA